VAAKTLERFRIELLKKNLERSKFFLAAKTFRTV
jgi:hypothetical protein